MLSAHYQNILIKKKFDVACNALEAYMCMKDEWKRKTSVSQ